MLNGIDPIIIFEFSKLLPQAAPSLSAIPIVPATPATAPLPPIPIYLSEKITGLMVDGEDKNIDIETTTDTLPGGGAQIRQKGLNSTIRVNMRASKNSIGLTLLTALADLIVPKVTSREYNITYMHGGVVLLRGLLHSLSVSQNSDTDLVNVTLELQKNIDTEKKTGPPEVKPAADAQTLSGGIESTPPMAPLATPIQGPPPVPPAQAPVQLGNAG